MQLEMQELGHRAQERFGEIGQAARQRAGTLQRGVEERISNNPLKAVLIAAGVGLLVGALWRR
jgi:ElaB/YqjD/DUF883 family membrane-anchored ribosome-binding protein